MTKEQLISEIKAKIKKNGVQEIEAEVLQLILVYMVEFTDQTENLQSAVDEAMQSLKDEIAKQTDLLDEQKKEINDLIEKLKDDTNLENYVLNNDFNEHKSNNSHVKDVSNNGFFISDNKGNIAFSIKNGLTDCILSDNVIEQIANKLNLSRGLLKYDYNLLVIYGQSLSDGRDSFPTITTSKFSDDALMFNQGLVQSVSSGEKYKSLVPLVEKNINNIGETPSSGAVLSILNNTDINVDYDKKVIASNCGMGGARIEALQKGTTYYNYIIESLNGIKNIADNENKTCGLLGVIFIQGESNYNSGKDYYKQQMVLLRNSIINDANAILKTDNSQMPFVTYQTCTMGANGGKEPDVSLAQLELASDNKSGFVMGCSIYQMKFVNALHISGESSKAMGMYLGKALALKTKKIHFEPLMPINHVVDGNSVIISFNKRGLKFDKLDNNIEANSQMINNGFGVLESNSLVITKVEIEGDNKVRITFNASPKNYTITYGYQNINGRAVGALRDSNNEVADINNKAYNLYNWCVIFNLKIK